jgi:hypothetical protein
MKRGKVGITVVVAAVAVCTLALLLLPSFIAERSAVPFQSMEVSFQDDRDVATMAYPRTSATQHRKNSPRNRLGLFDVPLSLVFVKAFSSSFVLAL